MNYPSIKTLETIAPDRETAKQIRGIIDGSIDPETIPATAQWVRDCYNRPSDNELRMHAADVLLGNFGVEAFETRHGGCEYSNAGDAYAATLIFYRGRYSVACWGDIAERWAL